MPPDTATLLVWAERMRGQPWLWGLTDCATLVIRGLELLTGRAFPGYAWASEEGALAVAQRERPSAVLEAFGLQAVPAGFQQVGDVILVPAEAWGESCHLCLGRYSLSATPAAGVGLVRTSRLLALPGAVVMGLR